MAYKSARKLFSRTRMPNLYDIRDELGNTLYSRINRYMEKFIVFETLAQENKENPNYPGLKYYIEGDRALYGIDERADCANCDLMRDIYKLLWKDSACADMGGMTGNAIISLRKPLNSYILGYIETRHETAERETFTGDYQEVSTEYCFRLMRRNNLLGRLNDKLFLVELALKMYTIGNFIPVPTLHTNSHANENLFYDYGDFTLYCIYNWYLEEDKENEGRKWLRTAARHLRDEIDYEPLEKWLASFKEWDKFVEDNYLQPFVYKNSITEKYEKPIEPWSGRYDSATYYGGIINAYIFHENFPKTYEDYDNFFKTAAECIFQRGVLMASEIGSRLKGEYGC